MLSQGPSVNPSARWTAVWDACRLIIRQDATTQSIVFGQETGAM